MTSRRKFMLTVWCEAAESTLVDSLTSQIVPQKDLLWLDRLSIHLALTLLSHLDCYLNSNISSQYLSVLFFKLTFLKLNWASGGLRKPSTPPKSTPDKLVWTWLNMSHGMLYKWQAFSGTMTDQIHQNHITVHGDGKNSEAAPPCTWDIVYILLLSLLAPAAGPEVGSSPLLWLSDALERITVRGEEVMTYSFPYICAVFVVHTSELIWNLEMFSPWESC